MSNFPKVLTDQDREDYGDDFDKDCVFTDEEAVISLGKYGALDPSKIYLEPCCGLGNLSGVLSRNCITVISTDKLDWGYGSVLPIKDHETDSFDVVLTNPPYSIWQEIIQNALRIARTDVYLFMPLRYLEGEARSRYFKASGLTRVLIFSYRVKTYRPNGHMLSRMTAYAWYHWDQSKRNFGTDMPTTIDWLYR